uniref:Uncharacterized protein n=1 Tax=Oryza glaberrima TaxID=4538 RepID=I1NQ35_ORYGL
MTIAHTGNLSLAIAPGGGRYLVPEFNPIIGSDAARYSVSRRRGGCAEQDIDYPSQVTRGAATALSHDSGVLVLAKVLSGTNILNAQLDLTTSGWTTKS